MPFRPNYLQTGVGTPWFVASLTLAFVRKRSHVWNLMTLTGMPELYESAKANADVMMCCHCRQVLGWLLRYIFAQNVLPPRIGTSLFVTSLRSMSPLNRMLCVIPSDKRIDAAD